jgi:hypothetical protein
MNEESEYGEYPCLHCEIMEHIADYYEGYHEEFGETLTGGKEVIDAGDVLIHLANCVANVIRSGGEKDRAIFTKWFQVALDSAIGDLAEGRKECLLQ